LKLPHQEFDLLAVFVVGGIRDAESERSSFDGRIIDEPADLDNASRGRDWIPIEVKRLANAGRFEVEAFGSALGRNGYFAGVLAAVDFSPQAYEAVKSVAEHGVSIRLLALVDVLHAYGHVDH
jgi:hypothetical protein